MAKAPSTPAARASDPAEAARAEIAALGKREFLDRFAQLAKHYTSDAGNPGSYACRDCTRCASCMFCVECDACNQCTHCIRCELCTNCSHSVDSRNCHHCAYCVQSEDCSSSAYLIMCRNVSDSTYCFGCVGITKKDFNILNVQFSRTEYFQIVKRLHKELGIPQR